MSLLAKKNRPMHFGPHPLEKIKRVDRPTTLIIDEEVKRVPKRADGFDRASHGDFGAAAQKKRVASGGVRSQGKSASPPMSSAIRDILLEMVKNHEGETAEDVVPITSDPTELANHAKAFAYFLDADQVGICEIPEYAWYTHDSQGNPIEPEHKHAIVILIDQGYPSLDAASGDDWISGVQSVRSYMRGAEIGDIVAGYIRRLGYPATCHSAVKSKLLQLPLVLLAGLGEMSRIGEVVINPYLGPRFKCTVVSTDMPLTADKPIDFGLQDFCNKCLKCARECPCGAIPWGDKVMYNGYETWKPDVQNCTSYRLLNPKGQGCGRCLKMCPWNKVDFPLHNLGRWLAINVPFMRRFLARLDDWMGYGKRNPVKKWWYDLIVDKGVLAEPKQTNERDLNLAKKKPKDNRYALYTPEQLPPGDLMETFPFDREQAIKTASEMETPDQARARLKAKETAGEA